MGKLVDLDDLEKTVCRLNEQGHDIREVDCVLIKNVFKEMPEIDAVPRVHARWIDKQYMVGTGSAECSACTKRTRAIVIDNGFSLSYEYPQYCPKCGAIMERK